MSNTDHQYFLQQTIRQATNSAQQKGGPFAAIIVQDGIIIGRGHNQVTQNCDPSAHAEIMAIRDACKTINNYQLNDCIIYASCEPCPMCMSAIYWARIPELYYAASSGDAAEAGFDDQFIYDELEKPYAERRIHIQQIEMPDAQSSFQAWKKNSSRKDY